MHLFLVIILPVLLAISALGLDTNDSEHTIMQAEIITKQGCQSKCGNVTVPYPFGIKSDGLSCSMNYLFDITCNNSFSPPKAFIRDGNLQVFDISDTEVRISTSVTFRCYNESGGLINGNLQTTTMEGNAYTYSNTNDLIVVGCDDYAYLYNSADSLLPKGCITTCQNIEEVHENQCSGLGCCQVSINLQQYMRLRINSFKNHQNVSSFNNCGYTFLGERSSFKFQGISDLKDTNFRKRTKENVRIVLDWAIGNENCSEAAKDPKSYACIDPNSYCISGTRSGVNRGYRCSCKDGYEGNPYLSPGCRDTDECKNATNGGCTQICNNTPGDHYCSCRNGYLLVGNDCISQRSKSQLIKFIIGMGFGCLTVIIGINWLICIRRERKNNQERDKFFHQNGGLLLKQQSNSEDGAIELTKHFTYEELKKATNNFAADRILGQGGYGVVYEGTLPDGSVVAIKKSKVMDQSQVEQFINEVRILTQVIHRNVVKLLGCCLECEVPLLVYEFVPNGTLFHHVHNIDGVGSWLSLESRLRIAAESSGALAYLHSAVSIPIIHRDVKLANILLDSNNVAKIADFGASRLIPMDQTEVTTLVQGTLGYLDPEYFHTGQLTEKSDVYSFGVVFAELLTGRQPICMANPQEERNLATYFLTCLKENRLLQIIEPRLVKEGTVDQLEKAAQLVKRCLNLNSDERPTMKEVTMEIESLRKFTKHPWANENGNEDNTSLIGHTHTGELQHSDLYEFQLSSYHNVATDSEQYGSSTISLLHPPTSPR
ncbi:wall-associated receptor kinase 2-like [Apium graveolens]|uniref:wall-associated receptor kinase 2-like n=1 Tax=Apium graveolens TaxID=4045 RepID=UPI003D7BFBAA